MLMEIGFIFLGWAIGKALDCLLDYIKNNFGNTIWSYGFDRHYG